MEVAAKGLDGFRGIVELVFVERSQGKIHVRILPIQLRRLDECFFRFLIVAHFFVYLSECVKRVGMLRRVLNGLLSSGKGFIKLWKKLQPEIAF